MARPAKNKAGRPRTKRVKTDNAKIQAQTEVKKIEAETVETAFVEAFSNVVAEMHPNEVSNDTNQIVEDNNTTTTNKFTDTDEPKSDFSKVENLIPLDARPDSDAKKKPSLSEISKKRIEEASSEIINLDNINYNRTQRIIIEFAHIRNREIKLMYPIKVENSKKIMIQLLGSSQKFTSANNDFDIKYFDEYSTIVWDENSNFAKSIVNKGKLLIKYIS